MPALLCWGGHWYHTAWGQPLAQRKSQIKLTDATATETGQLDSPRKEQAQLLVTRPSLCFRCLTRRPQQQTGKGKGGSSADGCHTQPNVPQRSLWPVLRRAGTPAAVWRRKVCSGGRGSEPQVWKICTFDIYLFKLRTVNTPFRNWDGFWS